MCVSFLNILLPNCMGGRGRIYWGDDKVMAAYFSNIYSRVFCGTHFHSNIIVHALILHFSEGKQAGIEIHSWKNENSDSEWDFCVKAGTKI